MEQPDPPRDQLDTALLRLLLIGAILRADAPVLGLLADVMQACGLLLTLTRPRSPRPHKKGHSRARYIRSGRQKQTTSEGDAEYVFMPEQINTFEIPSIPQKLFGGGVDFA